MKYLFMIITAISMVACNYNRFDTLDPSGGEVWDQTHTISQLVEGQVKGEVVVYGTVITSDSTGNFYKELIVANPYDGRAMSIKVGVYSTYTLCPIGSSVAIKLTGQELNYDQGLLAVTLPASLAAWQKYVRSRGSGSTIEWKQTKIEALDTMRSGTLVELSRVYFPAAGDTTYSGNVRVVELPSRVEAGDSFATLYTSPYASFASTPLPSGSWTLRAIVMRYSDRVQLRFVDSPYLLKQ